MKLFDAFSGAGFAGIGGLLAQQPISKETADAIFNNTPSSTKSYTADQGAGSSLSFTTKLMIAAGLTVVALYTVRRILK